MRPPHTFSVAPMMGKTDRHQRYLARRLTRRALLHTEMVVAGTILHHLDDGTLERTLAHHPDEHPLAIQLGGDDPAALRIAARVAEDRGFDEIDLNVGCPSDRVRDGCFGAALMRRPERVAAIVAAMQDEVAIPVTVKHRIGVDELDRYEDMARFVEVVAAAGVRTFVVHARKAWLHGLSPAQNRTVPPLRHPDVHRLKAERPDLTIVTNGGIASIDECRAHLAHVDGVMLGRAAYDDPLLLARVDRELFADPEAPALDVGELVEAMIEYARREVERGTTLVAALRHLIPLFHGRPGARRWRRFLSERLTEPGARPEVLREALALVPVAAAGLSVDRPPALTGSSPTTGPTSPPARPSAAS